MQPKFKLSIGKDGKRKVINLYYEKQRYRFYNANQVGVDVSTKEDAQLVKAAFELKLREGWKPPVRNLESTIEPTFQDLLQKALKRIQDSDYSETYKRDALRICKLWNQFEIDCGLSPLSKDDLSLKLIKEFINRPQWSPVTQKVVKSTFSALVPPEIKQLVWKVALKRAKSKLHKPIKNINEILDEVSRFNQNLYIVCLLIYGCLLRPHIECRLLKWSDIDLERNIISLSGQNNKSGRNRIVPIPKRVKEALLLRVSQGDINILSMNKEPYNPSYISTLWSRYKAKSKFDLSEITLYSLRHSSAIKVFEKTGSLQKLQQVMGHSSMLVSLTYLRGLEIQQLDVKDLPEL